MKQIQIFKPGTHTSVSGTTLSFSEADLAASAAAYDPAVHEAPIVIGHPKLEAPAYGWVKSLSTDGGALNASLDQVNADFAELVKNGAFKKVSASFYMPDASNNPKPGSYYLRHVGFLGAAAPALKGLKQVEFASSDEGVVTIEFAEGWDLRTMARTLRGLREWLLGKFGQEEADKALPDWDIQYLNDEGVRKDAVASPGLSYTEPQPKENAVKTAEQIAAEAAELKKQQDALKAQQVAFAESQAKVRRTENAVFLDGLIKEAKFPAGAKDATLAFMERLDAEEVVSFGEGDAAPKATERGQFMELLKQFPKAVEFGERAAVGDTVEQGGEASAAEIATKITAYRNEQKSKGIDVSFAEASEHVQRQAAK